jgi:PX domain
LLHIVVGSFLFLSSFSHFASSLLYRPDKHATRAIEEASTLQSAEFALQRAQELSQYLNELAQHPLACNSTTLRLFLALQDDMGTAWPEVSSNTLTRLTAVGASVHLPGVLDQKQHELEDNAELLALVSSEDLRMGAVTTAVPKLEGSITLMTEHADACGAVGMELSKLCKQVETSETEIPLSILSNGLLRAGRREKRLAVELSAAMSTFVYQYKLCRYEKLAFSDRRQALAKCHKERAKADERAQKLLFAQDQDRLTREAVVSDEMAVNAVREAEEIGHVLKLEVNRVAFGRRTEWSKSMKVVASAMKEASTERVAIWESTRQSFLQAFPESK